MAEKTFSNIVQEEIVDALMNEYDYTEADAKKFAKKRTNRIESEMWTTFDEELQNIMEDMKNG